MNDTIKEKLQYFERSIDMLNNEAAGALKRYNRIMTTHFDNDYVRPVIEGGAGNFILNISKVAAASTMSASTVAGASSAIGISGSTVAALPGPVAEGLGTVALEGGLPAIACALAAIGGLLFGKAIGEIGVGIYDSLVVGKGELKDLDSDVKKLKGYCNDMYKELSNTQNALKNALDSISEAKNKMKNQEYKTKESNVKRIKKRKKEIEAISGDVTKFMNVINITISNLSILS